ncbi:IS66 family transposase zinc-finger binding domain-containing protein [Bradyrhizobium sp. Leo121]|uniref:IS66 family transposase zinc-finger binding domain-containing protein n=1 Tax=Bradyrhizobium sp. Leo121 TaxID=1571195 RepID=UPI001FDFC73A|nr:IS66 family transposase zinc-finger binding domain-containing protein [Bradyrhizobium sp. Leo121]
MIETLELVPPQWKAIQHVREKLVCQACEAITQPRAPRIRLRAGVQGQAAGPCPQVRPAPAAPSSERRLPA